MAESSGSISIAYISDSKTLDSNKCLEKYYDVLIDIEGRIEEFNKQECNGFKEWQNLCEHINSKENDLNECYNRQLLTVYLNNSDKIKSFKEDCAKGPKYPYNPSCRTEGAVKLQAITEDTCGTKKECTEKTKPAEQQPEPKAKESESQPEIGTETHETVTPEGQNLLPQNHGLAQGEERSQGTLSEQVSHATNPSDNYVETQVVTLQSKENLQSDKHEQLETETESVLDIETPAGQKDTSSSKNSSPGDSDPNGSPEAVPPSSRGHQINSDASSDNNLAGHQASGKSYEEQNHGNKIITTETSDRSTFSLNDNALGENADGSHDNKVYNGTGTEVGSSQSAAVSPVGGDSVNLVSATSGDVAQDATLTDHVQHAATHAGEQAHDVVIDDKGCSYIHAVREGTGDETPDFVTPSGSSVHGECSDDRNHDQSVTCNSAYHKNTVGDESEANFIGNVGGNTHLSSAETPRTPLSPQDNSSIVIDAGKTVTIGDGNIMIYKKIILMSLIPLAIILLLTFLVKFTPLGKHFTNKKRKKQKDMTAKLQRILQEPSVEKDERTIPFSYSAFEYSSY